MPEPTARRMMRRISGLSTRSRACFRLNHYSRRLGVDRFGELVRGLGPAAPIRPQGFPIRANIRFLYRESSVTSLPNQFGGSN